MIWASNHGIARKCCKISIRTQYHVQQLGVHPVATCLWTLPFAIGPETLALVVDSCSAEPLIRLPHQRTSKATETCNRPWTGKDMTPSFKLWNGIETRSCLVIQRLAVSSERAITGLKELLNSERGKKKGVEEDESEHILDPLLCLWQSRDCWKF